MSELVLWDPGAQAWVPATPANSRRIILGIDDHDPAEHHDGNLWVDGASGRTEREIP